MGEQLPDNQRHDKRDDERGLERAIAALREDIPVRSEWRDALDRELLGTPAPVVVRDIRRGWNVSPLAAIAAALICMIAGAAANDVLRSNRSGTDGNTPTLASTVSSAVSEASPIGVRFSVMAAGVRRVSLVGDFNGWDANATPLELSRDGQTWSTMLPLAAGRHAYAFVIDGQVVRDPTAPASVDEDFGVPNSMVLVSNTR